MYCIQRMKNSTFVTPIEFLPSIRLALLTDGQIEGQKDGYSEQWIDKQTHILQLHAVLPGGIVTGSSVGGGGVWGLGGVGGCGDWVPGIGGEPVNQ